MDAPVEVVWDRLAAPARRNDWIDGQVQPSACAAASSDDALQRLKRAAEARYRDATP